ncbi:MAG TPA: hypothetical protein VFK69_12545 [Candidatus Eisenbacteria bacterium]|nr:hypothetical protein [Candidatus Eisenbacteria bacterium]
MTRSHANPALRRIVLVDFDACDADLLPELLSRPEVSVRLVAGRHEDELGVRIAELCELPSTTDLGDLTRELFDLALVSERSPRRAQIESLLLALGTPCASPRAFLEGREDEEAVAPSIEAPLALHAAALESTLGGAAFDALASHAIDDIPDDAPVRPGPVEVRAEAALATPLEDFPSPEDRLALETALSELAARTGALGAELHAGEGGEPRLVARIGQGDALLDGLIKLALELDAPQVVSPVTGPHEGRAWGAWPFRTGRRSGVVAANGIDPASGWPSWQNLVDELRKHLGGGEQGGK